MRTAVVSDLHLGALGGADVTRDPTVRERLVDALAGHDRVVLLGDALELRERPLAQALEVAGRSSRRWDRRSRAGRSCWCPATTTTG